MNNTIKAIKKNAAKIAEAINTGYKRRMRDISPEDFIFDDSRAWSFSISGYLLNLPCRRFGAYRGYLGGGVRGCIDHNGRDQDGTTELGNMFARALQEIESAYNEDLTPEAGESWEQASGVLL